MVRDLTVSTLKPRKELIQVTPPFNKIPRWERNFWGTFMFIGIMAYPVWTLLHLPDYRGGAIPNKWYIRRAQKLAEKEAAQEGA